MTGSAGPDERRAVPAARGETEEELERLHAAYWEGARLESLAEALGVEPSALEARFRQAGMPTVLPDYARSTTDSPSRRLGKQDGPTDARSRQMYAMYEAGATLEQVGARFGVTRARVGQVLQRLGSSTQEFKERRRRNLERKRQELAGSHRAGVRAAFERHGDIAAVAKELGLPKALVESVVREDPSWARRFKQDGRAKKRYSDAELMACLREAAAGWEGALTGAKYEWFARGRTLADGRPWPGKQTFALRYSSWRGALAAAGLPANPPSAVAGRRKFDRGRCIGALRHAATVLGKTPTAAEYDRLARESGGELPSQATVRHTFGTWNDALLEAEL